MEWQDKVKLLFGDMRSIDIPEKADILVTELLGSFGDNELSPECLDGAVRFLKRECVFFNMLAKANKYFSRGNLDTIIIYSPSCAFVLL